MNDLLTTIDTAPIPTDVPTLVMALVLAFMCGQLMAWVYMYTHTGLSYSRSFVSSLIVIPITVAMVMTVLDNNIVTAFSLLAVFAIVRFRNILRDTLDTVYILSLIVVGMACGTQKFGTAIIGTLIAATVLMYIWFTSFGARQRYDLILNIQWARPLSELGELEARIGRYSLKSKMASQRTSATGETLADLSYRVLLRDPDKLDEMLAELQESAGIKRVTTIKADDESEV